MERKSILCPNCRKLINTDEPTCPFCGMSKPASQWKAVTSRLMSPSSGNIIQYILYLNIFIFLLSLLLSMSQIGMSANPFRFLSPSIGALQLLGASGTIPIDYYHRWWSPISANYLHGGILHIFFNMMALRQLGPTVIQEYGANRMIIIYTLGGVMGFLLSYMAGTPFTLGASAAVCSLIGSILYYGKSRGGAYGQALYKEVFGWVIGLGIFGFVVPGIDNWAHGGGILGGILIGYILGYREKKRDSLSHSILAAACIVITLISLSLGIVTRILS